MLPRRGNPRCRLEVDLALGQTNDFFVYCSVQAVTSRRKISKFSTNLSVSQLEPSGEEVNVKMVSATLLRELENEFGRWNFDIEVPSPFEVPTTESLPSVELS